MLEKFTFGLEDEWHQERVPDCVEFYMGRIDIDLWFCVLAGGYEEGKCFCSLRQKIERSAVNPFKNSYPILERRFLPYVDPILVLLTLNEWKEKYDVLTPLPVTETGVC